MTTSSPACCPCCATAPPSACGVLAGRSVAAELVAGARPELLEWLAGAAHRRSSLLLEQAMQAAWQRAFDKYGFRM
ncbi:MULTISPECIES: hypothetical protein [unclassified Streptomyces]|uniref:hypothetical protein n=1 Tax=unclassified Streptomyces TaxID=2593676 RepID=UPI0035DA6413